MSLFLALKNKTYPAAAAKPAVLDAESEGGLASLARLALATKQNEKVESGSKIDVSARPVPILESEQQPLAKAKAAKAANSEQQPDNVGGNLANITLDASGIRTEAIKPEFMAQLMAANDEPSSEQPPYSGCEHVAIDGISCVFHTKAGVQEYVRLIAAGEAPSQAFSLACKFEDDFKQSE